MACQFGTPRLQMPDAKTGSATILTRVKLPIMVDSVAIAWLSAISGDSLPKAVRHQGHQPPHARRHRRAQLSIAVTP